MGKMVKGLKVIAISWVISLVIWSGCKEGKTQANDEVAYPRIVSLAPSITEIIFALGIGEHLVGVTDHCNYPALARSKPKLGGLKTIGLEAVVSKKPDFIFATRDGNEPNLLERLSQLGFKVFSFEPRNLEQVLDTIISIGDLLGAEEQAKLLVSELRAKQNEVEQRLETAEVVSVILIYQRSPLIVAGSGTFADDLIKRAKGENLAGKAEIPYPAYSLEEIIKKAPAVIVDVSMGKSQNAQKEVIEFWSSWKELPAVKNQRIYALNPDLITRPGPRLFDGLLELAQKIHPENFKVEN